MHILITYLRKYWPLCLLALFLAAINQIFSLLDPLIMRRIIDGYVTPRATMSSTHFLNGVIGLILLGMAFAMISRIAKNFQDYFLNVIIQKNGARIYQDGLRHSLSLPYQVFEDQRSGQTLSVLQKVRADSEKLIGSVVNILFTSLIGFAFVTIYAFSISWIVAVAYLASIPIIGFLSSVLSKKIKKVQKVIVGETTSLAGATTESLRNIELIKSLGLSKQEEERLNLTTDKILKLELKKVRYIRSLSFVQGTTINLIRSTIVALMMFLIFKNTLTIGDYLSLMVYSFFI